MSQLLDNRLDDIQLKLRQKGIELTVDHPAKQHLLSSVHLANCDGARGLERRIQAEILDRLRGLGPGRVRLVLSNGVLDVV
jgi:ATP-dependent Clp protease ATP-binding subunit ClpA